MLPPSGPPMLHHHRRCSLLLLSLWLLTHWPALVVGQTTAESSLLDPQYYSIAPCPCDLQPNVCDVGCCCDAVCSASDKLLFDCAQGFYGGNTTVELYRRCSSTDRNNPDYHPFTCVLIEDYNAYLGLYYQVQTAVRDISAFETKRQTASSSSLLHQFPTDSVLGLTEASIASAQRKGLVVLQVTNGTTPFRVDNSQLANYRLALPRRILGGGCDRSAGIVYLEDSSSACDLTVTAGLCLPDVASPLDAAAYATDCGPGLACEAQVKTRSIFDSSQVVPVTVTYRNLAGATVPRLPPSLTGTTCSNAVVGVQYSFVWSGSTLVSLAATVTLATVQTGSVITQSYSSAFAHLAGLLSSTVKRSGVVGYEPGAQLLGGARASGSSSGPVNSSSAYWPQLWRANSAGACGAGAAGDPVLFQMDASSYCTEQVLLSEFADCNVLRERLRVKLRAQFPAGVIGVFGSANSNVSADWVTVLEQGLVVYAAENFTNPSLWTNMTGLCLGLPTEIVLTVAYAEQGKANDSSIWQVVGAYLRYKQVHLSAVCGLNGCNTTSLIMSTGVQFVRMPVDWADNEQAYFGPYKPGCWWGICWEELVYPLTSDFEGESRATCIAWCIFLVLIAVYAFCISGPWW